MNPDRPLRVGMLVPSSNTCLEPTTYRIIGNRRDITAHFVRIRVTRIGLDDGADAQFAIETMTSAAALLSDAEVDVVAWNGTSGSWLGVDRDRILAAALAEATRVPATTSTLALLAALQAVGSTSLGLATPYTADVNDRIMRTLGAEGIEIPAESSLGISANEAFARVPPATVEEQLREVATEHVGAVAVMCTNVHGAELAAPLERELGIPVLDSVAVTLWHALRITGHPLAIPGYGSLLEGAPTQTQEEIHA